MHSFLTSIGYSGLKTRQEEEELIQEAIENAQRKHIFATDKRRVAELSFEVSENIGIMVRGEYDADDQFHAEHYFPYVRGKNVSMKEEVYINKKVDADAYTGMCDDYRLGVSMIFYLQNAVDYMKTKYMQEDRPLCYPVILAGLAQEGKILLPVQKDKKAEMIRNADLSHRSQLISEAKRGNQEAIESLTLDDIDLYSLVSKRVQKEDIYSIVDTSFIPYGSESDNYTVLGIIDEVNKRKNARTGEELFLLKINCNQMELEICVNKKNLLGEPLPGRRFRGVVWMQGNVDFTAAL